MRIVFGFLACMFAMSAQATREVDDFEGNTLVIGSKLMNQSDRYTIDVMGGDMKGSGWDIKLINTLPKNRFKTIIFENVGTTFSQVEWGTYAASSSALLKAYAACLQNEGEIRFQSFRNIFDSQHNYGNITGHDISLLITEDPIIVNDNGELEFQTKEPAGDCRRIFSKLEYIEKMTAITTGANPLVQACAELYRSGEFCEIVTSTNPQNDDGLLITAKLKPRIGNAN